MIHSRKQRDAATSQSDANSLSNDARRWKRPANDAPRRVLAQYSGKRYEYSGDEEIGHTLRRSRIENEIKSMPNLAGLSPGHYHPLKTHQTCFEKYRKYGLDQYWEREFRFKNVRTKECLRNDGPSLMTKLRHRHLRQLCWRRQRGHSIIKRRWR